MEGFGVWEFRGSRDVGCLRVLRLYSAGFEMFGKGTSILAVAGMFLEVCSIVGMPCTPNSSPDTHDGD